MIDVRHALHGARHGRTQVSAHGLISVGGWRAAAWHEPLLPGVGIVCVVKVLCGTAMMGGISRRQGMPLTLDYISGRE